MVLSGQENDSNVATTIVSIAVIITIIIIWLTLIEQLLYLAQVQMLYEFTHLIITTNLRGMYICYARFSDEGIETLKD